MCRIFSTLINEIHVYFYNLYTVYESYAVKKMYSTIFLYHKCKVLTFSFVRKLYFFMYRYMIRVQSK